MKIGKKVPKMEAKAIKCLMVGYSANHLADTYRLYNLETKKILNSRNVRWAEWHGHRPVIENVSEFVPRVDTNIHTLEVAVPLPVPVPIPMLQDTTIQGVPQVKFLEAGRELAEPETVINPDTVVRVIKDASKTSKLSREMKRLDGWQDPISTSARRSMQLASDPVEVNEEEEEDIEGVEEVDHLHYIYSSALTSDPSEPTSYKQAMSSPEKGKWEVDRKSVV